MSSIGGYISGNGYVWPFRAPAWHDHLDTQGSRDMARLNAFIGATTWYKLVPSGLNGLRTLITAGGGSSLSSSDYVAATATFDGTLLVAYIPPAHSGTITVDMTAMSGLTRARWFDPTSAVYTEIGSGLPNTGTREFTPPGNNSTGESDWILIMDTQQPPDMEPPAVTLTAPAGGTTVSDSVLVSATATDNVAVIGVRFQVDGVNLGAEVLSPPYTATWNTRQVGNGTHTVRAIARDLADNSASSSVSVTVSNDATNPLVAAYGFSEGSGTTVTDASVYGNTGTINGASWTSQGRFGSALNFNGAGNWVTVNDSEALDLTTGMTLEAWAYPTAATGTWTTIALKEAPPNALAYMMQADPSNHPSAYISTNAGGLQGVIGPQTLPLNTWTHLAATYDGAMLSLYVNGTVVASTFVSGNILTSGGPLRFGGTSIWGEYFAGTIDELRLYNRALSETEIQADMKTPIIVPTPTPTPSPTPMVDVSGNISYCSNPSHGPVPNVTLTLTGDATTSAITDASGNYQFSSLASGGSYVITPTKTALVPASAGINTVDAIAVQRHFLVLGTPLSGCKLAAADVNGDSAVNTVDAIAVQRFFLGYQTGIANTGKYQFTPASRTYPGLVSNQTGQNYDTLVFGDVSSPFVEPTIPPTPTPTATATATGTPTATATATPTATATIAPTPTPSPTPFVSISGTVFYCSNPVPGPVPEVTLTLTGTIESSTLSDESGNYAFSSLPSGGDYSITPTKAALPPGSAGINTVDVIAIQRHFLALGTPLVGMPVNGRRCGSEQLGQYS